MSANDRGPEVPSTERTPQSGASDWWIYRGTGRPLHDIHLPDLLPDPPPWRKFRAQPPDEPQVPPEDDFEAEHRLGAEFHLTEQNVDLQEVDMVNAALFLRRPLIVTGRPGSGKSALAYRIARELRLGRVLRWSITSRTTLQSGLYEYGAIGRAHRPPPGMRRHAGSTARAARTASSKNRRSAISSGRVAGHRVPALPHHTPGAAHRRAGQIGCGSAEGLLNIFEDAEFPIPELERVRARTPTARVFTNDPHGEAVKADGRIACAAFPVIVITSNGERQFPAAFLRRCLRFEMREPDANQLAAMVANHMLDEEGRHTDQLVRDFVTHRAAPDGLPADRLLEAVYLATSGAFRENDLAWPRLLDALWRRLSLGSRLRRPAYLPEQDLVQGTRPLGTASPTACLGVEDLTRHELAEALWLAAVQQPAATAEDPPAEESPSRNRLLSNSPRRCGDSNRNLGTLARRRTIG